MAGAPPELRPVRPGDLPFLRTMLVEAALWRPGDERRSVEQTPGEPRLARYLERWGRAGDFGLVAEDEGEPIGAAWCRLFNAEEAGYGFVDETVPELSVAVQREHRGCGVGTRYSKRCCSRRAIEGPRASA